MRCRPLAATDTGRTIEVSRPVDDQARQWKPAVIAVYLAAKSVQKRKSVFAVALRVEYKGGATSHTAAVAQSAEIGRSVEIALAIGNQLGLRGCAIAAGGLPAEGMNLGVIAGGRRARRA